jgi:membrane associated rhomboid family serine protease
MARRLDGLTFGGRVPWAVGLLLVITVSASLFAAFGSRHAGPLFALASLLPSEVWRGQIWRLVTHVFVEPSPLSLIFQCLSLYWFGRDLADEWGSRFFLRLLGAVVVIGSVGTCLVALVDPAVLRWPHLGGWPVSSALVIAWGLEWPDRIVRIYFVLPIRGLWIAWLTVVLTVVFAIYDGWESHLPVLFAEGATLAWMYRDVLQGRWLRARREAKAARARAEAERRRAASARQLRQMEAHDDEPPPLPPEIASQIDALLGKRGTPKK